MKRSIVAVALFSLSTLVHAGQTVSLTDLVAGNSDRIQQLKQGMARDEVVRVMKDLVAQIPGGTVANPYKAKTFQQAGANYEVLYYVTHQPTAQRDAMTTPVILRNGVVSGLGLDALRTLKQ
jgi:hypothetical protein